MVVSRTKQLRLTSCEKISQMRRENKDAANKDYEVGALSWLSDWSTCI